MSVFTPRYSEPYMSRMRLSFSWCRFLLRMQTKTIGTPTKSIAEHADCHKIDLADIFLVPKYMALKKAPMTIANLRKPCKYSRIQPLKKSAFLNSR